MNRTEILQVNRRNSRWGSPAAEIRIPQARKTPAAPNIDADLKKRLSDLTQTDSQVPQK